MPRFVSWFPALVLVALTFHSPAADEPAIAAAMLSPMEAAQCGISARQPASTCEAGGLLRLAAGGEACGCAADQACCEAHNRCCPATHPHHCSSGYCYATAAEAQADCGNSYEVCGVPVQ
jgi:hypothetical protein